jgi:hypothetical protein
MARLERTPFCAALESDLGAAAASQFEPAPDSDFAGAALLGLGLEQVARCVGAFLCSSARLARRLTGQPRH